MRLIRILIIVPPPHRCFYPLVDHASVVDQTLEPSVDDWGTRCHRPAWGRREFGGRALTLLSDRLPEVVRRESGDAFSNPAVKAIGTGTYCSSIRFISGDIVSNSFVLRLARNGLSSKRISSSS